MVIWATQSESEEQRFRHMHSIISTLRVLGVMRARCIGLQTQHACALRMLPGRQVDQAG